jgi:hypothetical protein
MLSFTRTHSYLLRLTSRSVAKLLVLHRMIDFACRTMSLVSRNRVLLATRSVFTLVVLGNSVGVVSNAVCSGFSVQLVSLYSKLSDAQARGASSSHKTSPSFPPSPPSAAENLPSHPPCLPDSPAAQTISAEITALVAQAYVAAGVQLYCEVRIRVDFGCFRLCLVLFIFILSTHFQMIMLFVIVVAFMVSLLMYVSTNLFIALLRPSHASHVPARTEAHPNYCFVDQKGRKKGYFQPLHHCAMLPLTLGIPLPFTPFLPSQP